MIYTNKVIFLSPKRQGGGESLGDMTSSLITEKNLAVLKKTLGLFYIVKAIIKL